MPKPKRVDNEQLVESSDEEDDKKNPLDSDDFDQQCELFLEKLSLQYRETRDEIRRLQRENRNLLRLVGKNQRKKREPTHTGFTKPSVVPECLAEFVGIDKDTVMARTQLTKMIYDIIKNRGLYYEQDKRVLRADQELMDIFKLPPSVNDSQDHRDKNGFNFFTLQKHIAQCYREDPSPRERKKKHAKKGHDNP